MAKSNASSQTESAVPPATVAYTLDDIPELVQAAINMLSGKLQSKRPGHYAESTPIYLLNVREIAKSLAIVKVSQTRFCVASRIAAATSGQSKYDNYVVVTKPLMYQDAQECVDQITTWAGLIEQADKRQAERLAAAATAAQEEKP